VHQFVQNQCYSSLCNTLISAVLEPKQQLRRHELANTRRHGTGAAGKADAAHTLPRATINEASELNSNELLAGQEQVQPAKLTPRTRAARFKALFKKKSLKGMSPRNLIPDSPKGFGFLTKSRCVGFARRLLKRNSQTSRPVTAAAARSCDSRNHERHFNAVDCL
jgi:hypothetical protein